MRPFGIPPPRGQIQTHATCRVGFNLRMLTFAQTHDTSLAELFLDLLDSQGESFDLPDSSLVAAAVLSVVFAISSPALPYIPSR